MRSEFEKFIRGDLIDSSLKVPYEDFIDLDSTDLLGRDARILELAAGKRVLHVGFADHPEVIDVKLAQGNYLHDQLRKVTHTLAGLDSNNEAISHLRSKGFADIFSTDEISEVHKTWDVVLIPDVIEHVWELEHFFEMLSSFEASQFVVTTPNALCWNNRVRLSHEFVNSDHITWYSPYTLTKLLSNYGFEVDQVSLVDQARKGFRGLMLRKYPLLREHLIISATRRTR